MKTIPLLVLVILSVHTSAFAAPAWLAPGAVDAKAALAPPPASGSEQDKADLNEVRAQQKSRGEADCKRAETERKVTLGGWFGPGVGGPLTAEEVERWTPFFKDLFEVADVPIQQGKKLWERPRPFLRDQAIKPCVPLEKTFSYPSGHGALSLVFARTLSLIDPKRATQFKVRALQIGSDRVLGGVHYPSDIRAGRKLGESIFEALERNAEFKKAVAEAKTAH